MTASSERLSELNSSSSEELFSVFKAVCHSKNWATRMVSAAPFHSLEDLKDKGHKAWQECDESDWLESLDGHPKIGDKAKGSGLASKWSKGEQSKAQAGDTKTLDKLREGQQEYEKKFGFIFLICATGLSSEEILASLEKRLRNEPSQELKIISLEQAKINQLRLEKLLNS